MVALTSSTLHPFSTSYLLHPSLLGTDGTRADASAARQCGSKTSDLVEDAYKAGQGSVNVMMSGMKLKIRLL